MPRPLETFPAGDIRKVVGDVLPEIVVAFTDDHTDPATPIDMTNALAWFDLHQGGVRRYRMQMYPDPDGETNEMRAFIPPEVAKGEYAGVVSFVGNVLTREIDGAQVLDAGLLDHVETAVDTIRVVIGEHQQRVP